MSEKTILALLGSPRKNGMTTAMLRQAVRRGKAKGYTVKTVDLYEQNIGFCQGCRTCIAARSCVQQDDLQQVARLMQECEIVFLAVPVYWANVPAVVKNLFDRLLGTAIGEASPLPEARLKGKKYILFTACNTPAPFSWLCGQSRMIRRNVREFFRLAGMKELAVFVCAGAAGREGLPPALARKIDSVLERKL